MKFETILTELRSEKFEWFGPSPIEPFNLGLTRQPAAGLPAPRRVGRGGAGRDAGGPDRHPAEHRVGGFLAKFRKISLFLTSFR